MAGTQRIELCQTDLESISPSLGTLAPIGILSRIRTGVLLLRRQTLIQLSYEDIVSTKKGKRHGQPARLTWESNPRLSVSEMKALKGR